MDLFFTLLVTAIRTLFGPRDSNVWEGTRYRFQPRFWYRTREGQLYPSRIPSFIDISLIKFFLSTRMSAVVRRNGWIPVVISSDQIRQQPLIPRGPLEIHTRVVGWEDQFVEIWHSWTDSRGQDVLNAVYLTRVTHSGRGKVTGADMLRELGEDYVERPLSDAAARLLADYLRIKDENQALSLA